MFKLSLLDQEVEVPFKELEASTSPLTGKSLRRIQLDFDVSAARSSEVNDALGIARNAESPLIAEESRWVVANSSYSYTEGSDVHHHHVELNEVEKPPRADRLDMLGLSLTPLRYEEEVNDGIIVISCVVACDQEDDPLERVIREERPSREYFDVVRAGVNDHPLRMRFGRCLWNKEGSQRLHLIRLVADANDPKDGGAFAHLHQPELKVAQRKIAGLEAVVDELLDQLCRTGQLSEEAMLSIRNRKAGGWSERFRDFDGPVDIDRYF